MHTDVAKQKKRKSGTRCSLSDSGFLRSIPLLENNKITTTLEPNE